MLNKGTQEKQDTHYLIDIVECKVIKRSYLLDSLEIKINNIISKLFKMNVLCII